MYALAVILTISPLLPLIAAQIDLTPSTGSDSGPHPNASYFASYNHFPNATGTGYISAVNTSFSDPMSLETAAWNTQINVTEVPWGNNQTVTNTVISLYTQDNIFASNSSWDTCIILVLDVARNATVKGQDDEGGCEQTFGEDCVGNFTAMIANKRVNAAKRNGTSACGGISLFDIPPQCAGSFNVQFLSQNITPNQTLSLSQSWIYSASEPHDPSNTTYYEEAATRIWPMVLVQSPKSSFNHGEGFMSAKMGCVRARNATEGSKEVDGVPGGAGRIAGNGFGTIFGWVMGVMMVVGWAV